MAQHDYVIANGTGAAVRSDLNNALAAIVTQNSGATEPTTTYAYQWWADTSTGLLKIRNGANNAWITLRELDGTLTVEDGTASAPGLAFADDLNTGIYRPGADQLGITTNGVVRLTASTSAVTSSLPVDVPLGTVSAPSLTFTGDLNTGIYSPGADQVAVATNGVQRVNFNAATEVVFNDGGADVDFRIEGDTKANLFKVDAGTDAVSVDGAFSVTGDATVGSLNGGPLAGTRNRIINGDMRIDQRATVATANSAYTVDRWQLGFATTGAVQSAQSSDGPNGFPNSLLFDVTTADTSIAAGEYGVLAQYIEGLNTSDLAWGTASAQTVTLSFWVKSTTTGTYCVSFRNQANNRSYVATYSVTSANTWEYKTITVAGDTSGTWLTTNNTGISIAFCFAAGSTFQTTAGAWQAGNFLGTSAQVNLLAANTNEIRITGVQLEPGTVATPFERRSYGQELALCQRYYCEQQVEGQTNTGTILYRYNFPVVMRATPTRTNKTAGTLVSATIADDSGNLTSAGFFFQMSATGANGYIIGRVNAFSAEL